MKTTRLISLSTCKVALSTLLCAFLLTSCNWDRVRGEGTTVTDTRSVGTFNSVDISDDVEVYLTQGTAAPLRIEGQPNILNVLETYVKDNELRIRYRNGVNVRSHAPVRVYVSNPDLRTVFVSGAATAVGQSDWDVDDFKTCVSGSGRIELALRSADDVTSVISGSGHIHLRGDSQSHEITVSGSGSMHSFDMPTRYANVRISGSGSCELTATQRLEARISGSSTVRYRGNPVIDSHISGSGRIVNAN